jgi:hypothetical protein
MASSYDIASPSRTEVHCKASVHHHDYYHPPLDTYFLFLPLPNQPYRDAQFLRPNDLQAPETKCKNCQRLY